MKNETVIYLILFSSILSSIVLNAAHILLYFEYSLYHDYFLSALIFLAAYFVMNTNRRLENSDENDDKN